MKYKAGDKVRIKSLEWYKENRNPSGDIAIGDTFFRDSMSRFCGSVVTIESIELVVDLVCYKIKEDNGVYCWVDEMIEGLVEEETYDFLKTDKPNRPSLNDFMDMLNNELKAPKGYIFKDENGNVINAQKIVLEKKPDDKLKLESTKKVREYWSEYARIFIEIYDDEPNECILTHLYTLESHRQKGYGRQALIEAESIAKELGCHTAYLKVETNSWMHEWYLRMGYKWYKTVNKEYIWLIKNL